MTPTAAPAPIATTSITAAALAAPAARPEERPPHPVGEERDRADKDRDEEHHADVAVSHVRELVCDHALELGAIHLVQEAAGDGDRGVTRVAPGGERVRRRILDDVELRRRDTESEGEGLDDVVQDLLLVETDRTRSDLREDHLVAGKVGRRPRAG